MKGTACGFVAKAALAVLWVAFSFFLMAGSKPAMAATLPAGFEDRVLASAPKPIALDFTPDGRMLVASQTGQLRVYKNGSLLTAPALNISSRICANNDRGLLGVAVDPGFSTNGYVYLFYTHNKFGSCPTGTTDPSAPVHRVSRFVMSGDTLDPGSERVLIDNVPAGVHHNAGDLKFGKDGYLYVTTGDGSCDYAGDSGCGGQNNASRDTHILLGKILRIKADGGIPSDNPYTGPDSARCNVTGRTDPGKNCQETFASGLRNPFRFAFDPDATGTRFFVNNVGESRWEQIDQGSAGADYGWNTCEGSHDNPGRPGSVDCASVFTPPIHEYAHDTGCTSVTGGAFVPNGFWPASYNDSYLFGDYVCNKVFELKPAAGGGFTATEFASGFGQGGPIAMGFGPSGSGKALYYTTYANRGEIHSISYAGNANLAPTASVRTTGPNYGPVPTTVTFDGSASRDPDGNTPLTYLWDFGDGTAPEETSAQTTSHAYNTAGRYTVTLTVKDSLGKASTPDTVEVFAGDTPPEPTIESPAADKLFRVDEEITLQGSATDEQDGQLSGSALTWEVMQHHNGSHTHPYSSGTGSELTITAPPPEALDATGSGNYLEIRFTATDSNGLSKTTTQELQPNRVDVTLASDPTGLSLEFDNESFAAPHTLVSWEGYNLNINAPSPQTLAGKTYAFASWSDAGAQTHDVVTEAQASTYTATYNVIGGGCTITGTPANDTLEGTAGGDVICGGGGKDTVRGLGGNDILKGEGGADKLYGGPGDDALDGGSGLDFAAYQQSTAAVSASLLTNSATGEGSDNLASIENLQGSAHADTLVGSDSSNNITGYGGGDRFSGGGGDDTLSGGGGTDNLSGGGGADRITGGTAPDALLGEDGDDALNSQDGVSGNDSLDGGPGTDTKTTDATEKSTVNIP